MKKLEINTRIDLKCFLVFAKLEYFLLYLHFDPIVIQVIIYANGLMQISLPQVLGPIEIQ